MDSRLITYETKCRRCGKLTNWLLCDNTVMTKFNMLTVLNDYINNPRTKNCDRCKKETVQDVVSHNINE